MRVAGATLFRDVLFVEESGSVSEMLSGPLSLSAPPPLRRTSFPPRRHSFKADSSSKGRREEETWPIFEARLHARHKEELSRGGIGRCI